MMHNLCSAPTLAFILGILMSFLGVRLVIPIAVSKFIALYLLFGIGFKGGTELAYVNWTYPAIMTMVTGLVMAAVVPIYVFLTTKNRLTLANAGAVAASYGSISVITFITATAYLQNENIPYSGYMVALMALMEFPAIIMGLVLIQLYNPNLAGYTYKSLLKEVFTNGSLSMLLGSLLVGLCTNTADVKALKPFLVDLQKGMLVFFLLDMGLLVGKNIPKIKETARLILTLGIFIPIFNAVVGILLTTWLGIELGDGLLLVILLASASYIAVPAAFRVAVPSAEPSLYLSAALAITFPFNVVIGLPLYAYILRQLL